jgi:hypothetical protein
MVFGDGGHKDSLRRWRARYLQPISFTWSGETFVINIRSLDLKINCLDALRRGQLAVMASPARILFCIIFSIACCIPINTGNSLKSLCIPPQYLKQESQMSVSSGKAADRPPLPPEVSVYGLMDHPVCMNGV